MSFEAVLARPRRNPAMKTLITVLTLAALTATSAVADPIRVKAIHADAASIYVSLAPGNETFPNTDHYFDGQNAWRND
jgi:hypothetical protein